MSPFSAWDILQEFINKTSACICCFTQPIKILTHWRLLWQHTSL
jgi:hypothetical protein